MKTRKILFTTKNAREASEKIEEITSLYLKKFKKKPSFELSYSFEFKDLPKFRGKPMFETVVSVVAQADDGNFDGLDSVITKQ